MARDVRPMLSRYSRDPLPSQIFMPEELSGREDVEPEMNQRSSARTARRKTRLVVRRGRIGVPVEVERENLRGVGAKIEYVPVPVLCILEICLFTQYKHIGFTGLDDVRHSRGFHE